MRRVASGISCGASPRRHDTLCEAPPWLAMADQRVDVTVVLGFLYLGSKKTARNKAWVRQNVRYVLNCTPTRDADPVAGVANYWEKDGLAKCVLAPRGGAPGPALR